MAKAPRLFPGPQHDHRACLAAGLSHAEAVCAERGARMTPNRRAVLQLLLSDHRPLTAYEIADRIDWQGRKGGAVHAPIPDSWESIRSNTKPVMERHAPLPASSWR